MPGAYLRGVNISIDYLRSYTDQPPLLPKPPPCRPPDLPPLLPKPPPYRPPNLHELQDAALMNADNRSRMGLVPKTYLQEQKELLEANVEASILEEREAWYRVVKQRQDAARQEHTDTAGDDKIPPEVETDEVATTKLNDRMQRIMQAKMATQTRELGQAEKDFGWETKTKVDEEKTPLEYAPPPKTLIQELLE